MSIILEKGYNTSGLYSFVTSLFYNRSDSINRLLNSDPKDVRYIYIQEFIKINFITKLQSKQSIPIVLIDRFRNLINMHNNKDDDMLRDQNPIDIYKFLISNVMGSQINIERVDPKTNDIDDISFDMIEINDMNNNKTIDLSDSIDKWIQNNVVKNRYSYRFKDIPNIVAIHINTPVIPINVKYAICFNNVNDSVQKIFVWEIHSIVLYDDQTKSYSTLINDFDKWYKFDENTIPSNIVIDMKDSLTINKISRQIKMVIYKVK